MENFSLIIPTRGRTGQLRCLLDSVRATTRNLEALEVILVMDNDDEESIRFEYQGVRVKRVLVPPGSPMGTLNRSGYSAASGRYLMLLNDDVVLRTSAWDETVLAAFQSFSDGIVLVHVNDLTFRDNLCVFPFLTREFCLLANGICPAGYRRYRVDDHIHNIFDLLSLLGHVRRVFLPEVVFEHRNVRTTEAGDRYYLPDPAIQEMDTQLFHTLLPERKQIALQARRRIDGRLQTAQDQILDQVTDSVAVRRREHARWFPTPASPWVAGRNPLAHFLEAGAKLGRRPNPLFDPAYYLEQNPDVAAAGANPLAHFLEVGVQEGRRPNPLFDPLRYLERNPEVAATGINPLAHLLERSRASPLARLSVVIPTHNRARVLAETLQACHRNAGGCELEWIVIDDGSTDDTVQRLSELSALLPNLTWHSSPKVGPGRARNIGAAAARHEVILFLGDDIRPLHDDFFRVHASLHGLYVDEDLAVLGKVDWPPERAEPVTYTMAHVQGRGGQQFGYSHLTPHTSVGWQYFYTANVSVKKALVQDWIRQGFDAQFPAAAYEDLEFAYRLSRTPRGLRIFYDPAALASHHHPYTLAQFMDRQTSVGKALIRLLELHPELAAACDVQDLVGALRAPREGRNDSLLADCRMVLEAVRVWAGIVDRDGGMGSQPWHEDFVSAVLELCLLDGFVSAWPEQGADFGAASALIVDRFCRRLRESRRGGLAPEAAGTRLRRA